MCDIFLPKSDFLLFKHSRKLHHHTPGTYQKDPQTTLLTEGIPESFGGERGCLGHTPWGWGSLRQIEQKSCHKMYIAEILVVLLMEKSTQAVEFTFHHSALIEHDLHHPGEGACSISHNVPVHRSNSSSCNSVGFCEVQIQSPLKCSSTIE